MSFVLVEGAWSLPARDRPVDHGGGPGRGLTVDPAAGTVSAPPELYQRSSAPHTAVQTVNAYVHQLTGVLSEAAALTAALALELEAEGVKFDDHAGALDAVDGRREREVSHLTVRRLLTSSAVLTLSCSSCSLRSYNLGFRTKCK
jgi:hypothetical protein